MKLNQDDLPSNGFKSLKAFGLSDFSAGFSVSLIALPLCLGIAIASGFPPLAGLVTAMVGGMLTSRISGSFVTISGPAAGLIVIAFAAAENLGGAGPEDAYAGYPYALAAILLGGAFVALAGFLKVGKIGDVFPPAVVHGMMAGIGIIIIIKQFFPFIGMLSVDGDILTSVMAIPVSIPNANPLILAIGLLSLLILFIHPILAKGFIKKIPAPLWVLVFTIPISMLLGIREQSSYTLAGGSFDLGASLLVNIPEEFFGAKGLQFPDFSKITMWPFWSAVISIALVSGVESLLSAKAVDEIDPFRRVSDLDRDLVAMGSGSSLAAVIGGLPMISEIVRSKANVENGGRTQWANFFHGAFLLIYLLLLTPIIEYIPLTALAAMLIFTGFRLASPSEFIHMKEIGWQELSIFLVTMLGVIFIDLLMGVIVGLLFKFTILIIRGVPIRDLFNIHAELIEDEVGFVVKIHSRGVIFSNLLSMKHVVEQAFKRSGRIRIDCKDVRLIDHTSMMHFVRYKKQAEAAGRIFTFDNDRHLLPDSQHPEAQRSQRSRGTK